MPARNYTKYRLMAKACWPLSLWASVSTCNSSNTTFIALNLFTFKLRPVVSPMPRLNGTWQTSTGNDYYYLSINATSSGGSSNHFNF